MIACEDPTCCYANAMALAVSCPQKLIWLPEFSCLLWRSAFTINCTIHTSRDEGLYCIDLVLSKKKDYKWNTMDNQEQRGNDEKQNPITP